MKKLAFEGATNFEMPKMEVVGLEKESNIAYADTGVSVYEPGTNGTGFSQKQIRAYAQNDQVLLESNVSIVG